MAEHLERIPQTRKLNMMFQYRRKSSWIKLCKYIRSYVYSRVSFYVCTVCLKVHEHMYCKLHKPQIFYRV